MVQLPTRLHLHHRPSEICPLHSLLRSGGPFSQQGCFLVAAAVDLLEAGGGLLFLAFLTGLGVGASGLNTSVVATPTPLTARLTPAEAFLDGAALLGFSGVISLSKSLSSSLSSSSSSSSSSSDKRSIAVAAFFLLHALEQEPFSSVAPFLLARAEAEADKVDSDDRLELLS